MEDGKCALLSDGYDKETNLEISLRISLSSSRMAASPGALQLFSLLFVLPDRILDGDSLLNSKCPIPDLPRCKRTLLRTSLAYIDADRLKLLPPVQEVVSKTHPPSYTLVCYLRSYWDQLLQLWRTEQLPSGDLIQRLTSNVGNITSLLRCGVANDGDDLKEVFNSILYLSSFTARTYGNHSPFLADLEALVDRVDDNQLRGTYVWFRINQNYRGIAQSTMPDLLARGEKYFQLANDSSGESRLHLAGASYYQGLGDMKTVMRHCEISLSKSQNVDNNTRQTRAKLVRYVSWLGLKTQWAISARLWFWLARLRMLQGILEIFTAKLKLCRRRRAPALDWGTFRRGLHCVATTRQN
ncbi:hypothetical protein B0H19DRAFT_424644 [Mycena capillaripes]|nr:hypothetical protein B0H19DRAFT_424644 [Mycena capillaripes]